MEAAESLHFKHILTVSFQIHCGGVHNQIDENCVWLFKFWWTSLYVLFAFKCLGAEKYEFLKKKYWNVYLWVSIKMNL